MTLGAVSLPALLISLLSSCAVPGANSGADARAFAKTQISSLKPDWNTSSVKANADPRIDKTLIDKIFKQYAETLGPVKEIGELQAGDFRSMAGIGVPDYVGSFSSDLKCEKGDAKGSIVVEHLNGKWLVQSLMMNSDLFDELKKKETEGAPEFVDTFLRNWLDNGCKLELLEEAADSACLKEIKKNEIAMKLLCSGLQKLGRVQKLEAPELQRVMQEPGGYACSFLSKGSFGKTSTNISVVVMKENGSWKIHNIQMNSNTRL